MQTKEILLSWHDIMRELASMGIKMNLQFYGTSWSFYVNQVLYTDCDSKTPDEAVQKTMIHLGMKYLQELKKGVK